MIGNLNFRFRSHTSNSQTACIPLNQNISQLPKKKFFSFSLVCDSMQSLSSTASNISAEMIENERKFSFFKVQYLKKRKDKKKPHVNSTAAYRPGNGTNMFQWKGEGTRRKLPSCWFFNLPFGVPHDFSPLLGIK